MKGIIVAAVAAAVLALVSSAEGAQPTFGPIVGGAYDELLPILVRGRTFVPSFKIRAEYDDNIFTEETDEVAQWKIAFEPKFDIHILRELSYYGLSYQYSLSYFEDREPSTDESHDLLLQLNQKVSERVELTLRDRYRKMLEPEFVEAIVEEGTADERVVTRRLRNERDYNVFSPTVNLGVTPKLNTSFSYDHIMLDYEDPEVSITGDYTLQRGTASANYIFKPSTYFSFLYSYQDIDYDSDENKIDSISNMFSVGTTHQFSPTLTATLRVGIEQREFGDYTRTNDEGEEELVTDKTQTAPYVNASLRAPLSETLSTELGYTYRIEETTESAFISQEMQSVYLGISQSFTDRFSAVFNATFDYGEFDPDEARFEETQEKMDEQTLLFALVFRYQIKPNWHAEVGWRFTDTDSDFPGQSYTRNRTFIGISAIF